jgi:hypothetical protein
MLFHVVTFDAEQHTLNFDGDETIPADATETSLCSSSGKERKLKVSLFNRLSVFVLYRY